MIKSFIPRVALINDLSGFGRVSLSEACPIISAMGLEACPLPTAVLSTHTYKFLDYTFCDLTSEMEKILNHWQKIGVKFDAVSTGYMASARQIEILSEFVQKKRSEGSLIVIDPVLGDNILSDAKTVYYDRMNDLLMGMKEFVRLADVITPNLTEACLLLDKAYPDGFLTKDEVFDIAKSLSDMGPGIVAITSIMTGENQMTTAIYDRKNNYFELLDCGYIDRLFHGTGDIFAAVMTGALVNGLSACEAAKKAVDFIKAAIAETMKRPEMKTEYGVLFEKVLGIL